MSEKITDVGKKAIPLFPRERRKVPRDKYDQPLPTPNPDCPDMQSLVIEDIRERLQIGIQRYGQGLKANTNRDMLKDAFDESLDLCIYLRGVLYERDGK